MRALLRLLTFLLILNFSITSWCQSNEFTGIWQIRKNAATNRVNLTLNILKAGETYAGSLVFVNPDLTTFQLAITNVSVSSHTLSFGTLHGGELFNWSLTVSKTDKKRATLRGHHHEMLVEERAFKKR